ncbi:MAG: hypothetical protein ACRD3E_12505 [Terriglobales bacterium]
MLNDRELRDELEIAPGKVYQDLDGSLVQLLDINRNLCSWVPINGAPASVQVTHAENFRRRFRSFDVIQAIDIKRSA